MWYKGQVVLKKRTKWKLVIYCGFDIDKEENGTLFWSPRDGLFWSESVKYTHVEVDGIITVGNFHDGSFLGYIKPSYLKKEKTIKWMQKSIDEVLEIMKNGFTEEQKSKIIPTGLICTSGF